MTEIEFSRKFSSERDLYTSYGEYLLDLLLKELRKKDVPDSWFVINPTYRVKDEKSILEKAFYRNKNYGDPYNDITDKVGIRFVFLTTEQVAIVSDLIEGFSDIKSRKDKDYKKEQENNPTTFVYQSVHYVVTLRTAVEYKGITIPNDIYCEIQVRTLLQHAYSELTHDTIYKPKVMAEPKTHRLVARSMALIETTDDIFSAVGKQIESLSAKSNVVINSILSVFEKKMRFEIHKKMNDQIFEAFKRHIPDINSLEKFIEEKRYVIERINERATEKLLYRQPAILITYFVVFKHQIAAKKDWPFTEDEIEPIYSDLGISMPVL